MKEKKYIMILGAGLMQKPSIEAARELGYKTIVLDANPKAVCVPYADRFEPIDLKDKEAIAGFALSVKDSLAAIFTAGTDFSASVSYACEKCGLTSHSFDAASNASNKILMRQCFKKHGVPSPDFFSAGEEYIESVKNKTAAPVSFPKVVKPVDNMGARGCRLVRNEQEFLPALEDAVNFSRTKTAIVEDYMKGSEYSIDALVVDGKVIVTGFADRHIFFEPYFIELGHSMPSVASEKVKAELIKTFTDGVHALGLTNGVAKGDIKYTEKGAMIGEIAARLSGGYMSGWTFPYSSGFNLTKEAMKISLGIKPDFTSSSEIPSDSVSLERAFISIPGKVSEIIGADDAVASPFVKNVFFRVKEGSEVDFPRNNVEKCGNIISLAPDRENADRGVTEAVSSIVLRLEPNNEKTDSFISGVELDCEKGFPYSAYSCTKEAVCALEEFCRDNEYIEENEPVSKMIPDAIRSCGRDFNFRTVEQSAALFDRICPSHRRFSSEKFWKLLLRGGIQAVLYANDSNISMEAKS